MLFFELCLLPHNSSHFRTFFLFHTKYFHIHRITVAIRLDVNPQYEKPFFIHEREMMKQICEIPEMARKNETRNSWASLNERWVVILTLCVVQTSIAMYFLLCKRDSHHKVGWWKILSKKNRIINFSWKKYNTEHLLDTTPKRCRWRRKFHSKSFQFHS